MATTSRLLLGVTLCALSTDAQRASWLAKLEAFDPELLAATNRDSLMEWIRTSQEPELRTASAMLAIAFAEEEDSAFAATLLFLIDQRLRPLVPALGDTCTTFLELLGGECLAEDRIMVLLRQITSADVVTRRDLVGSLPIPNLSVRRAHMTFRDAWREAPREAQHREQIHRGEPTPYLNNRGLLELMLFLAKRIEPFVTPEEHDQFQTGVSSARKALADPQKDRTGRYFARDPSGTKALYVADASADYAWSYERAPTADGSVYVAAESAKAVAQVLSQHAKDQMGPFLRELDEELRRLDVVSALRTKKPSSPVACALHRDVDVWLARLENDALGLLVKQGRKSTWLEGGRDEVLPCVPDRAFEKAVLAAGGAPASP